MAGPTLDDCLEDKARLEKANRLARQELNHLRDMIDEIDAILEPEEEPKQSG